MQDGRDETTGKFLPGNEIWQARASHGPNPKFSTPQDLWNACVEYFEWAAETPLLEDKVIAFQGESKHEPLSKMRAMTISALCVFLHISRSTWDEWRKSRTDLSDIMQRVEAVIFAQKFEGAAAGLLNANIIARDLGLVERKEHSGPEGQPLIPEAQSNIEIARRVAFMLAQGMHDIQNGDETK